MMIKHLVEWLILPPGLFVVLLVLAMLGFRRWWGRTAGGLALILVWALSTEWLSYPLVAGLQSVHHAINADNPPDGPAAIVVLGGGFRENSPDLGDTPATHTLERLAFAARLHRQTGLPILVTAGSPYPSATAGGTVMKESLENTFGVPVQWAETDSKTTLENASYSAPILKNAGIDTIFLVTNAMHMPRSVRSFEAKGLTVVAAPTGFETKDKHWRRFMPQAKTLYNNYLALHEWLGLLWYRLRYGV